MKNELGKYIEEYSVRNKEKKCDKVYSVTNSLGFVKSSDYFSKEVYSKDLSNYKIVLKNMIAYNPSRINVGSVSIQKKEDMVIVSPLYIVFSVNSKKLLPKYVNYFLHSDVALHQISNLTSGSVRDSLKYTSLKRIIIPVYSTEEQEKIINTLELLDEIIYKKNNQLKYFDDYIQFRFIEMFGNPLINEKDWSMYYADDICTLITDGSHFSPKGKASGYPMLSVKDMKKDGFCYKNCKYISKEDYKKLLKYNCKPFKNDVLISKDGSYFYYGFVVQEEIEQVILSSIAILRPDFSKINSVYLCNYMISEQIIRLVSDNYVTGVALKRVILKGIKNIPVMLPPLSLQNEFADFVREVDKSKFVNINNSIKLLKSVQNNVFCQRKKFYNVDNIYEYDGKECRI